MKNDRKKFFGVMFITALLSILMVITSIYFLVNKNNGFIKLMIISFIVLGIMISVLAICVLFTLYRWSYKGEMSKESASVLRKMLRFIYPIIVLVAKIIRVEKDEIRRSYCNINNILVENLNIKVNSSELLILLPHCLQNSECEYKITNDIYNCKRCGKCCISDIIELVDSYGIATVVATGGTLARAWVKKVRPKAIIAVACERDLTSGINDINKLPVYGVMNIRDHGPCYNTSVNIGKLKKAVELFLKK